MTPLLLSVIVPALNEERALGGILSDLSSLMVAHEVIVVDGGSADATPRLALTSGATLLRTAPGRGIQLRAGAEVARSPLLLFIHADARLDADAIGLLDELAVTRPPCAMAFRLRIDTPGALYRLIEWGTHMRSRLLGLPYGDQGLLVRRDDYIRAGGYPAIPLMEDVALVRALRGIADVHLLDAAVRVSARRWRREGPLRSMARNWVLLARFLTGAPPERLVRRYPPEGIAHE